MKRQTVLSTLTLLVSVVAPGQYAFAGGGMEPEALATTSMSGSAEALGTVKGASDSMAGVSIAGVPMQAILLALAVALVATLLVWVVRKQPAH